MPLGLYISVPFCRTKCTFCNFASGVTSRAIYARYIDRVCADIARSREIADEMAGRLEPRVDSIYVGGGTPSVLDSTDLERLFAAVRAEFQVDSQAEVTVECAPGTLEPQVLEALLRCGVNRVSLGVQSFVDEEAASVGRLHTRAVVLEDLANLRAAGITNISLDLIAGLPHQTPESWRYSVEETIASGVPHASVYMLEVDDESRLGRELIAGGTRYHAHFVPDDDTTADFYLAACDVFEAAGLRQYEISNFARETQCLPSSRGDGRPRPSGGALAPLTTSDFPGFCSRHNLKYWTRQPYLGFGVDAHSMLVARDQKTTRAAVERDITEYLEHAPNFGGSRESADSNFYHRLGVESVRFSTPDSLERYLAGGPPVRSPVSFVKALEESYFLGLRLNRGLVPSELAQRFGPEAATLYREVIAELRQAGLLELTGGAIRLTRRGRLLSNEVFEKFLADHDLVGPA